MFSATISSDIERIAKKYMNNPVRIEAESQVDPSKLSQVFYDVPQNMKFSLLVHLLKSERKGLVMVFCNTRRNTDMISKNLQRYNINSTAIHGGLAQNRRTSIIRAFHSQDFLILVCTDVAARGLDIKNVSHVYNYDVPKTSTEYIHRIGRTARAGKEGAAVTLVSPRDYENFRKVCEDSSLKIDNELVPDITPLSANFGISRGDGDRRSGGGAFNRGRSSGGGGGYRSERSESRGGGRGFGGGSRSFSGRR